MSDADAMFKLFVGGLWVLFGAVLPVAIGGEEMLPLGEFVQYWTIGMVAVPFAVAASYAFGALAVRILSAFVEVVE